MAITNRTAVWDCFLFNDELALLEFRLRLLDPVVDQFVLVEATRTHTGVPKRPHYADNLARFERHRHKIRHVLVDDMPEHAGPRVRERHQHAAVWRGLDDVGPKDLVLVGDLDEVPDPIVVQRMADTLQHPTRLVMRHYIYAANCELPDEWTDGTMAVRGDQLGDPRMALLMGDPDATWSAENDHVVPKAGCHLSYLGGQDAVAAKLRATPHEEFAVPALSQPRHIERCVTLGVHVAGIYAIERRRRAQLPDTLTLLAEMHPDLFDFRPGPPRLVVLLYLAYARIRTRLPLRLLDVIDAHPVPFGLAFGPLLFVIDRALRAARKYRVRHRARRAVISARRLFGRTRGLEHSGDTG
jgi:beta-1,4-mannosyl-glycoprotein beta-1,4-N-acetylglucosaminyltransferase